MTKIDRDDPRFTAKALRDESWKEVEATEIAAGDRTEFAELEQFAKELSAAYTRSTEAGEDSLDEVHLAKLQAGCRRSKTRKISRLLAFPAWATTLAATLVVGFFGWAIWRAGEPLADREASRPSAFPRSNSVEVTVVAEEPVARPAAAERVELHSLERVLELDAGLVSLETESLAQQQLEFIELPTFEKTASADAGYRATATLAGTHISDGDANPLAKRARLAFEAAAPQGPAVFGRVARPAQAEQWNRDGYARIEESGFKSVLDHPLSTFSIDVDTASYSNVRRFIESGQMPPVDAVRIEELVNYFPYSYAEPTDEHPVSIAIETTEAPWDPERRLVRVGVKAKELAAAARAPANLVFLVDVSGSMNTADRLPLAKKALSLMLDQMNAEDRIAIVVYAGASGLALPSTTANNHETIVHALERLEAGGSTNGGAGIELAYQVARQHFIEGGINRVVLCTDGDFNVGVSDEGSLTRLIEEKAKTGVFFSAMGFGRGNYRDDMMEILSNKGNGNYAYIDSEKEARKVFGKDLLGTLQTVAKDVKIQVEFNPVQVQAYRLIGYENRALAKEDFNDDRKDAGEVGVGHRVTALYEIVPAGRSVDTASVDPLKYQSATAAVRPSGETSDELLTVKLRYKEPEGEASKLVERSHVDGGNGFAAASEDLRFAASVAAFGMLLRDSEYSGKANYEEIRQWAREALGSDEGGMRSEFVALVEQAKVLADKRQSWP